MTLKKGSKRHNLQAVELDKLQIVSNPPAPSIGVPIYIFLASRSCVLDIVVISGDVCCSVVFFTLVVVFSVMWSELLMTSAISCPLWSSVYKC